MITTVGDRGRHPTDLKVRAHDAVATDRRISVLALFTTCDAACSSGVTPNSQGWGNSRLGLGCLGLEATVKVYGVAVAMPQGYEPGA